MPAAFLIALLNAGSAGAEDATIVIESGTVRADDLSFAVRLDTAVPISGTLNDIVFDPPALIAARENGRPQCVVDDSIEKGATQFTFQPVGCAPGDSCSAVRAHVFSIENVSPIPSGSILYTCLLAADTPAGSYPLHCANPGATDLDGGEVAATCVDGEIEVAPSTFLAAGTDDVHSGETALVEVRAYSTEAAVRIITDLSLAPLPIRGVGAPACAAPGDAVDATFTYRPEGCALGETCTGVHAVVASRSGEPLASGQVLFTCGVDVPVSTPSGDYVVHLSAASGIIAGGAAASLRVADGAVLVEEPPPTPSRSTVEIGSASGAPGSVVQIAVTLHTDEIIGGFQNDLRFEQQASIAALPGGSPDCTPDPSVDRISEPEFAFQPPLCTPGIDCTAIRALILTAEPGTAIPDGKLVYTCNVTIAAAASGRSALTCFNAQGTTPEGQALPVACTDGAIDVVVPTSVPTATPLPATATPTLASGNSGESGSSGGSGCAIGGTQPGAWWWPLPLLLALRRRRRR